VVFDALARVAHETEFHPVRDYFASLKWDGVKRLDNWLIFYLGVEPDSKGPKDEVRAEEWDSQRNYIRAVGSRYMISAVARVFRPRTKADCVLILEGPQGIFKSTIFKTIGDPLGKGWFTDELADIGSKDAAMQLSGKWIIELAELDSMTRSDVGRTKAFISRASDYWPMRLQQCMLAPVAGTSSGRSVLLNLLCDDDPDVRGILGEVLQTEGYVLHLANGPSATLRILEGKAEIDLLIVDYAMPEMNGLELIQEACQRRPSLKTLLITGDVGALSGGISRVPLLSKPFGPTELAQRVSGILAA
jgi:CheY-like chemotaxis protein